MCKYEGCTCRTWTEEKIKYVLGQRHGVFASLFSGLEKYTCLTPGREGRVLLIHNWEDNKELLCVTCCTNANIQEIQRTMVVSDFHYITVEDQPDLYECYKCKKRVLLQRRMAHTCELCCLEFLHHAGDVRDWHVWGVLDRVGTHTHTDDHVDVSDQEINVENVDNENDEKEKEEELLAVPGPSNVIEERIVEIDIIENEQISTGNEINSNDNQIQADQEISHGTTLDITLSHTICQHCNKRGHTADKCYKLIKSKIFGNNKWGATVQVTGRNEEEWMTVQRRSGQRTRYSPQNAVEFLQTACSHIQAHPTYTPRAPIKRTGRTYYQTACSMWNNLIIGGGYNEKHAAEAAALRMWQLCSTKILKAQGIYSNKVPIVWGEVPRPIEGTTTRLIHLEVHQRQWNKGHQYSYW